MAKNKNKDVSLFWITVKFVTPVVVLLSLIEGPHGKPFIDWSDMLPSSDIQHQIADLVDVDIKLGDFSSDSDNRPFRETKTTVYKWQDENGRWHFSQDQPQHMKSDTLIVSNKINSMKAIQKQQPEKTTATSKQSVSDTKIGLPYGKVHEIIKDAKNLQNISNTRAEKLNNL